MLRPDEGAEAQISPTSDLIARAQGLLTHVEIADVRPCRINATIDERVMPASHVMSVDVELRPSYAAGEGLYANRFDFDFVLKGESEAEILGRISFSLLIDYRVPDGFTPEADAAEYVAGTTGYFAAHPYARELFQSLAARLQIDPMVLGLVKRGSVRPGAITVATRPAPDS